MATSEPVLSLAAVCIESVSTFEAITELETLTRKLSGHLGKGKEKEPLIQKANIPQSSTRPSIHGVRPNHPTDSDACQVKDQNTKQEAQFAGECKQRALANEKRKEADDSARRVAAIKHCEGAEKRRQREAKVGHQIDADAPEKMLDKAPDASSSIPTHKATLTKMVNAKAIEPKRLTPRHNAHKQAAKLKPKLLSPIDTYEISDREESTDDEEDNEERRRKHMPAWASGTSLREALRAQANSDPSAVFAVGASSCDLKHIFKTDRVFKKRTSSQNWGMDLSTQVERQKYRTEMGFTPLK